jgi:hypothetical protein
MMKLFIVTLFLFYAAPTYGGRDFDYSFKPLNCRGENFKTGVGLRQHSYYYYMQSVNIPVHMSKYKCEHFSATINGQYFSQPTRCVGLDQFEGEFDVNDKTCSVDHSWLFEKIGNVIGKDIRCTPRWNSDGCTTGAMPRYSFYHLDNFIWKDYLNAACVVHDMCYTTPASFGITQGKCDELARDLRRYRCEEVTDSRCLSLSDQFFKYDGSEFLTQQFSDIAYMKAQMANTPCYLTVKQRESSLYQGRQMNVNATRWSPNGNHVLTLRPDGNLIIYRMSSKKVIWSSKTQGRGVVKAVMQYDGNFVLYTEKNEARWHTGTDIKPTNHLLLQDDGNLVVYSMGSPTSMWASKGHGGYLIPMSTNLRSESLDSTSIEDIGTIMMQEDLSEALVDIVHFDRDPNSAGTGAGGAPDQTSQLAVNGVL